MLVYNQDWWFVRIPRTGSTSFMKLAGIKMQRHVPISKWPKLGQNLMTVAFVRNPFDRMVSAWEHSRCRAKTLQPAPFWPDMPGNGTFTGFIEAIGRGCLIPTNTFDPQVGYVKHEGEIKVSWIGLFERYDADTKRLCKLIGIDYHPIHEHKSPLRNGQSWQDYYTPATKAIVADIYREDIQLWEELTNAGTA